MKNILNVFFAFVIGAFIVIMTFNSCNSCNNTDKERLIEILDSIKANDPYELNVEHLPYHTHYVQGGTVHCYNDNIRVYKFNYNGHTYIMFSNGRSENGVVHDPDCPCYDKN